MIDVEIFDIVKEERSNVCLVLLTDRGERVLPIFIGAAEGMAIAAGIRKTQFPRPMTYDLVCNILLAAGIVVHSVDISELRQSTYYSTIRIKSGDSEKAVDSRPSDAMAFAVRMGAQIRAAEEVMNEAAVKAPEIARSAQGMVAMLRLVHVKLKQAASNEGWTVPELVNDAGEAKVRSLLADS